MNKEDAFWTKWNKTENYDILKVLADFLEEQGREGEAEGLRWLADTKKRPINHGKSKYKYPWTWHSWPYYEDFSDTYKMPGSVGKHLTGKPYGIFLSRDYRTRIEAMKDAALAYGKWKKENATQNN